MMHTAVRPRLPTISTYLAYGPMRSFMPILWISVLSSFPMAISSVGHDDGSTSARTMRCLWTSGTQDNVFDICYL